MHRVCLVCWETGLLRKTGAGLREFDPEAECYVTLNAQIALIPIQGGLAAHFAAVMGGYCCSLGGGGV